MKNTTTLVIAGISAIFIIVIAFMYYRMSRMEDRYLQLLSQSQQTAPGKDGRNTDPYISGPVKNTVVKHSSEILACYKEFLERNKSNADLKFIKEGSVSMDWQISEDGVVLSPEVVRSNFTDAEFHACIIKKIEKWRFPEPPFGSNKYVEHTFRFQDEMKK